MSTLQQARRRKRNELPQKNSERLSRVRVIELQNRSFDGIRPSLETLVQQSTRSGPLVESRPSPFVLFPWMNWRDGQARSTANQVQSLLLTRPPSAFFMSRVLVSDRRGRREPPNRDFNGNPAVSEGGWHQLRNKVIINVT